LIPETLIAFAFPLILAISSYRIYRLSLRARRIALVLLGAPFALDPLLVPSEHGFVRVLAAITAGLTWLKLLDLHIGKRPAPPLGRFIRFLLNPMVFVERLADKERLHDRRIERARLLRGLALVVLGLPPLVAAFFYLEPVGPPWLDHLFKLVFFYVALIGLLAVITAIVRFSGGAARVVLENVFTAATPAEFWRRYNRAFGQLLYEDIFKSLGGRRAPARALLLTFFVSAVLHEYLFDMGLGRIDGEQFAFFMLQGIGAVLTLRLRPKRAARVVAIALTLAFNDVTSYLFFAAYNELLPLRF
jgi:hypothetical protein